MSLPVTMTVMTHNRPVNKTSKVTRRQKKRRTGLKSGKIPLKSVIETMFT
jgi:hypothetical protein